MIGSFVLAQKKQKVKFYNPDDIAKPFGYSHIAVVSSGKNTAYISGQLGFLPNGKMAGEVGDFKAQAYQAFKNIEKALIAVGAEWKDVVKINMYLTDVKNQMSILREVRDSFVNTKNPPASTTVEVSRLVVDGALFEIDAIVVIP